MKTYNSEQVKNKVLGKEGIPRRDNYESRLEASFLGKMPINIARIYRASNASAWTKVIYIVHPYILDWKYVVVSEDEFVIILSRIGLDMPKSAVKVHLSHKKGRCVSYVTDTPVGFYEIDIEDSTEDKIIIQKTI